MIALIICLLLCQLTHSIYVTDPSLSSYNNLQQLIGIHQVSILQDTPPSTSNFTIYFDLSNNKNDIHKIDVENCPSGSQICGLETVSIPGKPDIVTKIISVPHGFKQNVITDDAGNVLISLNDILWGQSKLNFEISFECSTRDEDVIQANWDSKSFITIIWKTSNACASDSKNPPPPPPKQPKQPPPPGSDNDNDDSSSWGWFTWIFIFLVIIFAGYVIGNAWINANSNGSNEFLNELVDSLVDVLNKLPSFLKEIWNKLFGDSERGGYSAV